MKKPSQKIIDVLSNVLSIYKMGNSVICNPTLSGTWGMNFEPDSKAMFHLIQRGHCVLKTKTIKKPIQLMQGDIVLIPRCNGHILADNMDSKTEPFKKVIKRYKELHLNSSLINKTSLLCGVYSFRNYSYNPILSILPEVIHIPSNDVQNNMQLQALIQLISLESKENEIGAEIVISKLIDAMFIYIVRTWLQKQPKGTTGWLGALKDERIGLAIGLIHKKPSNKWTVGSLAKEVHMSRASFAQKFNNLVGIPPLTYLTKWRMDLSSKLLIDSKDKLIIVASEAGYESENSFSKAFKKIKGISPGEYRTKYS